MQRPALQKCIAVALALLVWQGAAMAVGLDLLLPSPWQVACRLWSVWREPGFFATVAFSLLRISGGFALGLVLGVLLAVARGGCGCWSFCCGPMSRPSSPCRWRRSSSSA